MRDEGVIFEGRAAHGQASICHRGNGRNDDPKRLRTTYFLAKNASKALIYACFSSSISKLPLFLAF
jgi:hypothetical protein